MRMEPYRIQIQPDGELARLLDEAGDSQVVLEMNGKRYRLVEEAVEDNWTGYDPVRVKAALQSSAGALAGVDREQLLAALHAARTQQSHGRPA